ncbi:hypothetical protein LUR56_40960 [Streptomyces sp. MT29]|nr:hypothetical protein [Streptomyces sp. MT29]
MPGRICLQGILFVLNNDIAWQLLPLKMELELELELVFGSGQTCWRRLDRWAGGGGLRPAAAGPALGAQRGRRTRLVPGLRGRLPHPGEKGGVDTVDRGKTGSKHHLICDGRGTPLKVITTAANVNALYEVQHLLGHESFQTTQRYAHLQPDAHKAVLGAWERMETPLTIAA